MQLQYLSVLAASLATSLPWAAAHPGMGDMAAEIARHAARQIGPEEDSFQLLGDLVGVEFSKLNAMGQLVSELLNGNANPTSKETYRRPGGRNSAACRADPCCGWSLIADDMYRLMKGKSGRCTKWARYAVRMGFHDAGSWDRWSDHGGADGSIVLAPEEILRPENRGLEEMKDKIIGWHDQYGPDFDVSHADLIQFAANVAAVTCPLGPRIRTFVGRRDSSTPAPEGRLPPADGSASFLMEQFANKTIRPHGLAALLGAHSISMQRFVDPSKALFPQDPSPGVWDVDYYAVTLDPSLAPPRMFVFVADKNLAEMGTQTQTEMQAFGFGPDKQFHWNQDYAKEYIRLSLLGVDNIQQLKECTKVLPQAVDVFDRDSNRLDKWLNFQEKDPNFSEKVNNGDI